MPEQLTNSHHLRLIGWHEADAHEAIHQLEVMYD